MVRLTWPGNVLGGVTMLSIKQSATTLAKCYLQAQSVKALV